MIFYRKRVERDIDSVYCQLKMASGIKSDVQLPHGFESVASFDFGDIFVDEAISEKMKPCVQMEIDSCLCRFLQEDYGLISDEEKEQNGENKYFGNGCNLIAKYQTSIGIIEIVFNGETMISLCL